MTELSITSCARCNPRLVEVAANDDMEPTLTLADLYDGIVSSASPRDPSCIVRPDALAAANHDLDKVCVVGTLSVAALVALLAGASRSVIGSGLLASASMWSAIAEIPIGIELSDSYDAMTPCEQEEFWGIAVDRIAKSAGAIGVVVGAAVGSATGIGIAVVGGVLLIAAFADD